MKAQLKGKTVTLVEDGWSNVHNDPVLATCLQTESSVFFLDARDPGSLSKTAENCKELCQASIVKAETDYGCTVRNIVTDNAKNMEKMRDALKKDDPELNVYEALAPHQEAVRKRFNQAIKPCHLVAYLLHPKYQGSLLTSDQHDQAYNWLTEKNPDYLVAAIQFDTKSAPYPASFFLTMDLHPVTWWKGLSRVGLPEGFVETMVSLHTACASSASIERVFSSFGIIHNKLRNRLGVEKATKLVFCYRMLRGKKDIDY